MSACISEEEGVLMTPGIVMLLPHLFYSYLKVPCLEECLVLKYR